FDPGAGFKLNGSLENAASGAGAAQRQATRSNGQIAPLGPCFSWLLAQRTSRMFDMALLAPFPPASHPVPPGACLPCYIPPPTAPPRVAVILWRIIAPVLLGNRSSSR